MAIYHLHAQAIGRSNGGSAVAAAAYRSTSRLHDERTDKTHDYSKKEPAIYSEILAKDGSPKWVFDRQKLWNEVERVEDKSTRRLTAQTAKEIRVALPKELTNEQNINLVRNWSEQTFTKVGLVADIAIHKGDRAGNGNIHAHILITTRRIREDGFDSKKARDLNEKNVLMTWRESWEKTVNHHLEMAGKESRISSKTLKEQGIDKVPTVHRGHGEDRPYNKEKIMTRIQDNDELSALKEQRRKVTSEIKNLEPENFKTVEATVEKKIELKNKTVVEYRVGQRVVSAEYSGQERPGAGDLEPGSKVRLSLPEKAQDQERVKNPEYEVRGQNKDLGRSRDRERDVGLER